MKENVKCIIIESILTDSTIKSQKALKKIFTKKYFKMLKDQL